MKFNRYIITIIILIILLVAAFRYIFLKDIEIEQETLVLAAMQQGAQQGYEQAVVQIMTQASKCQPVPIFYENTTINMIAVECLQQQEQG